MSKKQFLCILEHFYEIVDFCCSLDLRLMRFKRFQIDEVVSEGGLGSQNRKNEVGLKITVMGPSNPRNNFGVDSRRIKEVMTIFLNPYVGSKRNFEWK